MRMISIKKSHLVYFDIFTTAQEIQVVEFPAERMVCTIPLHDLTMLDSAVSSVQHQITLR
jgi:hypothetical protein